MKVDTTNTHDDFEPNKPKAVLNTSKAKGAKTNYHSYKLSMPDSKRSIKTGSVTHTSSKRKLNLTSKRSMQNTNTLSQSIAYTSGYSKLFNKQNPNINAMTTMQYDIDNAKENIKLIESLREKADKETDETKQLVLLNKENIVLRDELRTLNNGLTKFIELIKQYKIKKLGKPRYNNENYSVEYKLQSRDQEEKNYNTMIQNMNQEYVKLKKRFDMVGDPTYSFEIKRQIAAKKMEIKEVEEAKRQMMSEKFQRDK